MPGRVQFQVSHVMVATALLMAGVMVTKTGWPIVRPDLHWLSIVLLNPAVVGAVLVPVFALRGHRRPIRDAGVFTLIWAIQWGLSNLFIVMVVTNGFRDPFHTEGMFGHSSSSASTLAFFMQVFPVVALYFGYEWWDGRSKWRLGD